MKQFIHKLAGATWVLTALASGTAPATTLHVWPDSPNPTPPYDSWGNAATNIQDAVDVAQPGDLVLVTNGVYATGERAVSGTTNRLVVDKAVTVQSINGPEVTVIEGALHIRCAYVGSNAVLNGFTLTQGNVFYDNVSPGGGAWCESSATVTNCVVTGNSAYRGGGVCGGMLYYCTVTENWAYSGGGGYESTLDNCTLTGNWAYTGGGAYDSTLTNCTLTDNEASWDSPGGPALGGEGGGVYGGTLHDCLLSGNVAISYFLGPASYGGGAYQAILYNCTLTNNSGSLGGGAYLTTLYNCTVTSNSAEAGGGTYGGTLYNCTLTGNGAAGFLFGGGGGGGVFVGTLYNCTVTDNSASAGGGVSQSTLYNCIVYFNSALSGSNYSGSTFNYSCTTPLPSDGTNNIAKDPRLATLTHLSTSSPCVAAGSSAYASGLDIDGEPWGDPPCMGADQLTPGQATGALRASIEAEYTNVVPGILVQFVGRIQGATLVSVWDFDDGTTVSNQPITSHAWSTPGSYTVRLTSYNDSFPNGVTTAVQIEVSDAVYYVNQANPAPMSPYTSWATAATTIQDAIGASTTVGRIVLVTNGVYASGSVSGYGNGTNRAALTDAVQLRSINGPDLTVIEGAPGIRCAYLGPHATLSGFTLGHGEVHTGGSFDTAGGGAFCASSAILTNCIVTGNSAIVGAGVYGGRLYNCTLTGNSAVQSGGGSDLATLYNCTLTENRATYYGGGAYGGTLYNCTVTDNSVSSGFYGSGAGGGVFGSTLRNCIVYFNSAPSEPNYSGAIFDYSCTTPLPADGTNNIAKDPQLATLTHLSIDSPCLAAGTSAYATGVDIDGEPWGDPPCMGADQLTPSHVTGTLTMAIEAQYTNVTRGVAIRFLAWSSGAILASVWDFGDGTLLTNQPVASHVWSAPGIYSVQLTGYNDSFPNGVAATVRVQVSDTVCYVNQSNPTPLFPYNSWATAATNIQDAIGISTGIGRLVVVTNGVYASGTALGEGTNRIALGDAVEVRSVNGPEVTVIEGQEGVRCAYVGTNATLDGFTLTRGNAAYGGGAWCESSATLTNCVLTDNSAQDAGGASSGGTLYNCAVTGNSADNGGGSDAGTLYNCIVMGNWGTNWGGGVYQSTLHNCTLSGNSAYDGGGAYEGTLYNCTLTTNSAGGASGTSLYGTGGGAAGSTLYRCTLTGNSAGCAGGGSDLGTLYNCTLTGNSAGCGGGGSAYDALFNCTLTGNSTGMFSGGASGSTLFNCTVTGNSGDECGGVDNSTLYNCIVYFNSASSNPNYLFSTFHYSCTFPYPSPSDGPYPPDVGGNITNAPVFVDRVGGNLRLQSNSPGINAGDNAYVQGSTDLDGRPRIAYGIVDMGAYEFQLGVSGVFLGWLQLYGLPTDGSADTTDFDGDLVNNWQEWVADTDPTDSSSFFHIDATSESSPAMISFQSSSNRLYTLWRTLPLAPANWTPVPGDQAIPGNGSTLTLSDPTHAPRQFYRVQVNLP